MDAEKPTLTEFVEEQFWPRHAIPNLSEDTRDHYCICWEKHAGPRLGDLRLGELRPAVLQDMLAELSRQGVGVATIRKTRAMVSSILSKAVLWEQIDHNPMPSVKPPPYRRKRDPYIFRPAEVEAIRARLSHRNATLVSILAYTGPRPEEALRLRNRDVGAEKIRFDGAKTGGRTRWTPLLAPLAQDLREWDLASGRRGPNAPIIPNATGDFWSDNDWRNWRNRVWKGMPSRQGQAGRPAVGPEGSRPRDLRSSYVTLRVYEGIPLTTVAKECGTSVEMIDKHYSGVYENWDGRQVPADEQIRAARAQVRALRAV